MLWKTHYEKFVTDFSSQWPIIKLHDSKNIFVNFPIAHLGCNITFLHFNRSSGLILGGKVFFSERHKLYGRKVELSVLPNGIKSHGFKRYLGCKSNLHIFTEKESIHFDLLVKNVAEIETYDVGILIEKLPDLRAMLCDKK